jgi:hypothetical protein
MQELIEKMGESAGVLLLLIPPLVQILKRVPIIAELQKTVPVYELLSIALGIGGAYALGIPVPIINGIVAGLAAGKGYDFVKSKGTKK